MTRNTYMNIVNKFSTTHLAATKKLPRSQWDRGTADPRGDLCARLGSQGAAGTLILLKCRDDAGRRPEPEEASPFARD